MKQVTLARWGWTLLFTTSMVIIAGDMYLRWDSTFDRQLGPFRVVWGKKSILGAWDYCQSDAVSGTTLCIDGPLEVQWTPAPQPTPTPTPTPQLGTEPAYVLAASHLCGVPVDRIMRVIKEESGGNPRAVSKRGARGLMQLMPRTAKMMGVKDIFDPYQNVLAGTCYLSLLKQRFGTWEAAHHAYNAGPTAVVRNKIPRSTRNYADTIMEGEM